MKEFLDQLTSRTGVRGALLMTADGVLVADELCDGLKGHSVAALISALLTEVRQSAAALAIGAVSRVTLATRLGRLVIVPSGDLLLTVVTEPGLDLDLTLLEIAGPAGRLRDMARLDI